MIQTKTKSQCFQYWMTANLIFFGQSLSLTLSLTLTLSHSLSLSAPLIQRSSKGWKVECLSVLYWRGNVLSLSAHLSNEHKSRTRRGSEGVDCLWVFLSPLTDGGPSGTVCDTAPPYNAHSADNPNNMTVRANTHTCTQ